MDKHQLQQKQLFTHIQKKEQATTYLNKPQKGNMLHGMDQPRILDQPQEMHTPTKKGMLNDVSLVAIVASTLASLTSFVLSSHIGLTGSLIGVGIAAAASALASQVCSSVLTATGEKLKAQQAQQEQARLQQVRTQAPAQTSHAGVQMPEHNAQQYHLRLAPQSLRLAATQQARKRLVLIGVLSTLAALACVGIYAAVVIFATHGEGIGSKQVFTPTPQEHNIQDKQVSSPKKEKMSAQKRDNASTQQNKGVSTTQNAQDQQDSKNGLQKDIPDNNTEPDTNDQKNSNEPSATPHKHEGSTQGDASDSGQEKKGNNANQPNGSQQKSPTDANEN